VEIKQCVNKCTLPDGTNMPDNSYVLLSFWNMGRAEDIWGPDASEWRPERWTEMKERPSDYKFPAFQAGRRACLGKRMAMLELKVLVHHLLYNYKFEASADQKPVEYEVSMTLPMRHPLLAKASKRNKH
jgi:cytochrome P450